MLGLGVSFYKVGGDQDFWNPTRVVGPDPKGWYRPNDIIDDEESNVTGWTDSSGDGNDLSQSTSDNQAAFDDGGLLFDGSNDHYDFGSTIRVASQEAFTLFMVLNLDDVNTQTLLGIGSTSEFLEIQTNKRIRAKIDGTQTSQAYESVIFPTDQKFVLTFVRDSGTTGNVHVYIDGTLQTPTSQQANPGAIDFTVLGSRGSDRFLNGHIYEVIIYDTEDMESADITRVCDYLKNNHGI